jgi:hypothetical protein
MTESCYICKAGFTYARNSPKSLCMDCSRVDRDLTKIELLKRLEDQGKIIDSLIQTVRVMADRINASRLPPTRY